MIDSIRRNSLKTLAVATVLACMYTAALAEGGSLAEIKARGQLTVGTEAAYEPYEFVENGVVVGYGRDVLDYMAAKLGVKLVQLNLPFQGLLPGLMSRRFDFVATSTPNSVRLPSSEESEAMAAAESVPSSAMKPPSSSAPGSR